MRVKKLNSDKEFLLTVKKYGIDWENSGASSLEIKFRDLIYPHWRNSIILYQPRIPGSLFRLDFLNCNKRLCVEINGPQHDKFNKHFHNNSRMNYLASIKRDIIKSNWLIANNIALLELNEEDLKNFSLTYVKEKYGIDL